MRFWLIIMTINLLLVISIASCKSEKTVEVKIAIPVASLYMNQDIETIEKELSHVNHDFIEGEYVEFDMVNFQNELDSTITLKASLQFDSDKLVIFQCWYHLNADADTLRFKKWFTNYYHLDAFPDTKRELIIEKNKGYKFTFSNPRQEDAVFYYAIYDLEYLEFESSV